MTDSPIDRLKKQAEEFAEKSKPARARLEAQAEEAKERRAPAKARLEEQAARRRKELGLDKD